MATAQQTDDDKKRQQAQTQQGFNTAMAGSQNQDAFNKSYGSSQNQNTFTKAQAGAQNQNGFNAGYPFAQTFQSPATSQAGQQTPMPWSGTNTAYSGGGTTPWAQNMAGFNNAYAQHQANQGAQAGFNNAYAQNGFNQALGGAPNWQALAQRFGGGQQLGNASPAFQRPQFGGFGGQGMAGGQQNPWLQQLMQGAAQRIAAARAAGGAPQQGLPQQQGFAMPQWGGGMPGRQY